MRICLSVDVEPDCPPYLESYRGIEEGLPRLLDLLGEQQVSATFFTTGEVARRFPQAVQSVVEAGHELGCHGDTHRSFLKLDPSEARAEIATSAAILREFASVTSFRAPYLQFPTAYLKLLESEGFNLDSSQARYKLPRGPRELGGPFYRVPASTTSSVLRLPRALRNFIFSLLADPVVLFIHPWEFCDFRADRRLRPDCRFGTGPGALDCLRSVLDYWRSRGTLLPLRALTLQDRTL